MPATAADPIPTRSRPLQWLRGLFSRPLKIERRGAQLHVVLGQPAQPPASPARPGEVLRHGHVALCELLARHPDARHLMRHLSFFEQALGRLGSRALRSEVPVAVLRKAHEQLELLLREDTSPELVALAKRIERSIADRTRAEELAPVAGQVQVSEASHSLFDEMERSWTGQIPLSDSVAPPASR